VASTPGAPIYQFVGAGQALSKIMTLAAGAYVVNMSHKGAANFTVWADDASGTPIDLLVNEIGAFKGSKLLRIAKDGNYLFDVAADGDWAISVAPVK
jgi:predicted proteasome-type protease